MSDNIIFGVHAINNILETNPNRIEQLYIQNDRDDKKIQTIIREAKSNNIKIQKVSRNELDKMTTLGNHQGVAALCKKVSTFQAEDLESLIENLQQPPFLLVLDGVQDPHNLGACMRTADAAGVHAVIVPKDNAVGITGTVAKVASGAVESVPLFQVTNLARTLAQLKEAGVWIYGADEAGESSLFQTKLTGPIAIVLGAEGAGLRRLTKESCDVLVKIPMQGLVSSLNVSVATGVFLFEAVRQRSKK